LLTIKTRHGRSPDPHACRVHLPSSKVSRPPDSRSDGSPDEHDDQAIRCSVCEAAITGHRESVTIDNRHEHAFFNPAGIAFEIRCFRRAPGAVALGTPSSDFTWFPPYRWQVALCATCQTHLGWLFTNGGSFYGLIAARLT
jgi:hypothetical protein